MERHEREMIEIKEYIMELSNVVIKAVRDNYDAISSKKRLGLSPGGDTQFSIDEIAEKTIYDFIANHGEKIAYYSEDRGLVKFNQNPEYMLIIDPIDGTRGAAAGLECCCFSIAVAEYSEDATINDVKYALLYEFKNDVWFYSDYTQNDISVTGAAIKLSPNTDINNMFWSMEFNGHPARLMTYSLGDLIDLSANQGGIFIFNSSTYSISRIITGQLDAYVDIGNRLLKDVPELDEEFRRVGNGQILHLFPYDISAAVYLAKKAGVVITDAYGNDLGNTRLADISDHNLQSCVAAGNKELHSRIIEKINWIQDYSQVRDIIH